MREQRHDAMMPDQPINANHLTQAFAQAAPGFMANSPVHAEVAARMADRLADIKQSFAMAVDVSLDGGHLAETLFHANSPEFTFFLSKFPFFHPDKVPVIVANPLNSLPFCENKVDLVTSNLHLPWVADVPQFLLNCGRLLKPNGLFLASTLGLESFREFRQAFATVGAAQNGHILPLTDVRAVGSLLQSLQFALPVVDRDVITLTFPDFPTLYRSLRACGAKNLNPERQRHLQGKQQWKAMEAAYQSQFQREDGRLPLTLEVIYLHGWMPHENQQKPLTPGAFTMKLDEVL